MQLNEALTPCTFLLEDNVYIISAEGITLKIKLKLVNITENVTYIFANKIPLEKSTREKKPLSQLLFLIYWKKN